jgi:large subunit ribosomal protein L35Ae
MNYRIGIRTQASRECLIQVADTTTTAHASKIVGKKVVWQENKKIAGTVLGFHGKNGVVRARFKKGLPGQALGTTVEIVD